MDRKNNYVKKPLPGAPDLSGKPLLELLKMSEELSIEELEARLDQADFYDAIGKDRKSFPPVIIGKA